jgi:hypothetical protein
MAGLRRFTSLLVTIALLATPIAVFTQRQDISDWWRLRDYDPPARVAELASSTAMTDYGKKLFYVHKPELDDRATFSQHCVGDEQTIVLGCYFTHRSIFIFDVEDERLAGIEEVTAAHEMLHAAYDRLDAAERQRVDGLTSRALGELTDKRIRTVVEAYRVRDPSVVPNELHSILATEVRKLPAELEDYYSQYFADRGRVVDFSEKYEAVFTAQQKKIEDLKVQIDKLEQQLGTDREVIKRRETELTTEADRLSALKNSGQINEYNAAVGPYNSKVQSYRLLILSYNQRVGELNSLIEAYNSQAVEQKELFDAINSSV